ncbi:hypothetical protein MSAS_33380 [Mycobacterium saskatchewanense]|uniref:Sulfotransferase family protein n=2 Tax=Mycobacterium saskatchewanense TaxID=220927 RepID=A0AAJ3NUK9_9MYCO|nr:hypothetical protein AWC23_05440 [Mycobacterium saskatchewanense]BBX64164.1 hypothetical protein MSAS_33380 [Mycobacterium saskatchewanense]
MTIVTQYLNRHHDIEVFDEIDLIQVVRSGGRVMSTLQPFLIERGVYESYHRRAVETADPALALRATMSELARPCTVWGEKNPRYATQLGALRHSFPGAAVLFVLRDPREVVNSCLAHRGSLARTPLDFWIKDTVAEALALVERHLEPLEAVVPDVAVLRYEAFVARPEATLDAALGRWGLSFSAGPGPVDPVVPETAADHQFFRDGAPLPWKLGNLSPLCLAPRVRDRIDADDPVWARVDALARRFGYGSASC